MTKKHEIDYEPMVCLIDGAAGIYAWHELVTRYDVFVSWKDAPRVQKTLYSTIRTISQEKDANFSPLRCVDVLRRLNYTEETINTIFHPDTESYLENVADLEDCLFVKIGERYWSIYQEGDIFAVNPDSEWSNETESFEVSNG